MQERRRSKRHETALANQYTKIKGPATIQSTSITRDISRGGMCTSIGKMVKRKDILLIEFDPVNLEKPAALAEVVWVKASGIDGRNLCGLKFLWTPQGHLLENYLLYAKSA